MQSKISIPIPSMGSSPESASKEEQRGFLPLLDGLLRQRESYFDDIFSATDVSAHIRRFLLAAAVLGGIYGLAMGASGLRQDVVQGLLQMLTSAVKVPLLYLLSLVVCYPVLFIVVVLMGSKLSFRQTLAMILMALTFNSVLLASCAPIVLFFIVTGSDYSFIKLLHVGIFAFSGIWAMLALLHGLRAMCEKSNLYPKQAIRILQVWVLIFGFVGTQMAWTLRPFVGSPDREFEVFRKSQEGNFYLGVWHSVADLARQVNHPADN